MLGAGFSGFWSFPQEKAVFSFVFTEIGVSLTGTPYDARVNSGSTGGVMTSLTPDFDRASPAAQFYNFFRAG